MPRPKPYAHQLKTLELLREEPCTFDMSDAGTAKTRPALEFTAEYRKGGGGKTLVLAVKTNLETVWQHENLLWTPELKTSVAYAHNRRDAFARDADIYITNHDAVKWIAERPKSFLNGFDRLIIDESTAYKHRTSQRSKAVARSLRPHFKSVELMSGTPAPNGVLDMWHQAFLLDRGQRLGKSFSNFRQATHYAEPTRVSATKTVMNWVEKDASMMAVFSALADVSVRHDMDECTNIPPNHITHRMLSMPARLHADYRELESEALLATREGTVKGVHAAALRTKLLQVCSGAVYTEGGRYTVLDRARYEFVADLIEERPQTVLFFNWQHQKDLIADELTKRKIPFAVLDGTVRRDQDRTQAVNNFQGGQLRALLIHPKTGAHGLTLTKGTTCIWASPIYEPDLFKQGIHRIRRAGQTKRTETICVQYEDSVEGLVYTMLQKKDVRMHLLLDLMAETSK